MINQGKCPHCQQVVRKVKVEDIDIQVGFQDQWRGFSYLCTSCSSVLSVQMNPRTLNSDLKDDLLKSLHSR